jgi:Fe2+ transport system protein B
MHKDKGGELFNATGSQYSTLQNFIQNSERKRISKNASNYDSKFEKKIADIELSMKEKKQEILLRYLKESSMTQANKMAIIGDEMSLRNSLVSQKKSDTKDGLVLNHLI